MKRIVVVLCAFALVVVFAACGNLTAVETGSSDSGTLRINMNNAAARVSGPTARSESDVSKYQIILLGLNASSTGKIVQVEPGDDIVVTDIKPGSYMVFLNAWDENILFAKATSQSVTISADAITEVPLTMQYAAIYRDGNPAVNGIHTEWECSIYLGEDTDRRTGECSFTAPAGKRFDHWVDDAGNTYSTSDNVSLLGKQLPVHLMPVWIDDTVPNGIPLEVEWVSITGANVSETLTAGSFTSAVTVGNFKIAPTETTFEMWCEIRDWAKNNGYTFQQQGHNGNNLGDWNKNIPAYSITPSDMLVWCNAASERAGLTPVYVTTSGQVLKDATNETDCLSPCRNSSANGYRLPTDVEWEYAARGGDPTASCWAWDYAGCQTLSSAYANYGHDEGSAYEVKGERLPNSCGLYDMCGNVSEVCWRESGTYTEKGGYYESRASSCRLIDSVPISPNWYSSDGGGTYLGFRLAQNAN